ncbi:MAG: nuclear transport factor 2 family protein [Saprospiraceae bacterium]|nr:nuclear transport factor 2 family protein [Saprospiraceae bacterium]
MDNKAIIEHFYQSFAKGDAESMVSHYADNITFEDPAFGRLQGKDAKDMWRMLINNNRDGIKITYGNVQANDTTGSANWQAEYTFSQTGRFVVNKIHASFVFKNGQIIQHTDYFDMWRWSRQALGLSGWLLGWSGFMKNKIQQRTNSLLAKYQKK